MAECLGWAGGEVTLALWLLVAMPTLLGIGLAVAGAVRKTGVGALADQVAA